MDTLDRKDNELLNMIQNKLNQDQTASILPKAIHSSNLEDISKKQYLIDEKPSIKKSYFEDAIQKKAVHPPSQ